MVKMIEYIPFFLGVAGGGPKMNLPRIFEAVLIAAVTAGVTGFVTLKVVEQKALWIEARVDKIEIKIDKLVNDLYEPRHYAAPRGR